MVELFRHGLAVRTAMIWVAFFCCLLMVYALSSVAAQADGGRRLQPGSSLSFLLALNLGGMAGALLGGRLGDRLNLVQGGDRLLRRGRRLDQPAGHSTARCRCCTC